MNEDNRALFKPRRDGCGFIHNQMPCPRRAAYFLNFEGEAGQYGRSKACYHHMMGYMLAWEYAGQALPAFLTRVVN